MCGEWEIQSAQEKVCEYEGGEGVVSIHHRHSQRWKMRMRNTHWQNAPLML
jgi:hypothetical protein